MVPGRLTRSARKQTLHLPIRWPWAERFTLALQRLDRTGAGLRVEDIDIGVYEDSSVTRYDSHGPGARLRPGGGLDSEDNLWHAEEPCPTWPVLQWLAERAEARDAKKRAERNGEVTAEH